MSPQALARQGTSPIPTIQIAGMKGKDMVGQKGPFYPHTVKGENRCSTLFLTVSNEVWEGFDLKSTVFLRW